jgi:hypothetical protein
MLLSFAPFPAWFLFRTPGFDMYVWEGSSNAFHSFRNASIYDELPTSYTGQIHPEISFNNQAPTFLRGNTNLQWR